MGVELRQDLAEEVEVLRAIYGDEAVRVVDPDGSQSNGTIKLEVDLQPLVEEGSTMLVWVCLALQLPAGYPAREVPKVEVEKSRGIGDVAIEAMMEAAKTAIKSHGLQDGGCLAPVLSEISDALSKAVSECSICMMDCDPGDAIFVACGCVFHEACLSQWRGLKDKEKSDKADAATESIKSERDALARQCADADKVVEEMAQHVASAQQAVDEAVKWATILQKKASAAAGNEDEEEEMVEEEEPSDSDEPSEEDDEDRWGTPQPSLAVGWGAGKKKHYKASTTRNKRRPRKYLKRIEDKIQELKQAAKAMEPEEVAEAVRVWEKATFEVKEAKAVLEKQQDDERKAQERANRLAADHAYMQNYLSEERAKFTYLPLLCPVCQNAVDGEPETKLPEKRPSADEALAEKDEDEDARARVEAEQAAIEAARVAEERERSWKAAMTAVEDGMLLKISKGAARHQSSFGTDGATALLVAEQQSADNLGLRPTVVHATEADRAAGSALPARAAAVSEEQRQVDEELMVMLGQLMEAYAEETVSAKELLVPFGELMDALSDKSATDREIKEVLSQMMETLQEDVKSATTSRFS